MCRPVFGSDTADWSGGVAGHECVRLDVAGHDAAGADYGTVAYGHTGEYNDVRCYPHIVSNRYGAGAHLSAVALRGGHGMGYGAQSAVGTDENVVADAYLGFVENRKVEISAEIFANRYVESEIAVERAVDEESFPCGS